MIKKSLILLTVTLATTASAALMDPSCCPKWNWCGETGIGADLLYWKPMTCNFQYGTVPVDATTIRALGVKPSTNWGFRVLADYTVDCFYTRLSYLRVDGCDREGRDDNVTIGNVAPLGPLNEAGAKLDTDYQNIDLRFGQYLCKGSDRLFSLFAHLRWTSLKQHRIITGQSPVTPEGPVELDLKADFSGIGLGVGTAAHQTIWCDLGIFGEFGLLAIIGDRDTPRDRLTTSDQGEATPRDTHFRSNTAVVPGADLRLGLDYSWQCGRYGALLELGYEVNYYWNTFDVVDQFAGLTIRRCQDLGFGGLTFGATLFF